MLIAFSTVMFRDKTFILENLSIAEFAVRHETISETASTEEDADLEFIEIENI